MNTISGTVLNRAGSAKHSPWLQPWVPKRFTHRTVSTVFRTLQNATNTPCLSHFFLTPLRFFAHSLRSLRLTCLYRIMIYITKPGGGLKIMDNFEQRWLNTEMLLKERFDKVPDMEGILFLIGVNELGRMPRKKFSKEQKQDLMHVAVCTLLSQLGYYAPVGRDEEGWPHFNELMPVPASGIKDQEQMLKECVVRYFEQ